MNTLHNPVRGETHHPANPEDALRLKRALVALQNMRARLTALEAAQQEPIAIIGMGCRFPGADSPAAFWQLLQDGRDLIGEIPKTRWDVDAYYDPNPEAAGKMYTRHGGFLDAVDAFDARFFNILPREAMSLDPQQRLLLEVSWEALEHAAINPQQLLDSPTGVFVGIIASEYMTRLYQRGVTQIDGHILTGNLHSAASGRLSYLLGLHGPSLVVDTACSSSLVAVHLAVTSLRNRECNLALVGAVNLLLSPDGFIDQCRGKMLSAHGRCKSFDADAGGYVRSEGCGVVVLKRLSDALAAQDNILAVIRGSAVQQDGHTNGLTAPNGLAQQAVVRAALKNSGVAPAEVRYVETHGSGTPLGDPIEINALGAVFGDRTEPLLIGTVKTNIGHLESAAGMAGLIKSVLALQHGEIPPNLHFQQPNPHIAWDQLPIQVVTQRTPWPRTQDSQQRIAGVSSFGFSGTIAHVVLAAAPTPDTVEAMDSPEQIVRPQHLLTLSAQTEEALNELAARYAAALKTPVALGDVCYTTQVGRAHFRHRLAVTAATGAEAAEKLTALQDGQTPKGVVKGRAPGGYKPKIGLLFTGQGAQAVAMGRQLYETLSIFRAALDRCQEILRAELDTPLLDVFYPEQAGIAPTDPRAARINETAYTQPALFAIEYALSEVWKAWGIQADVVMGHSAGEYAAACVAGVFSLEDGLRLSAARGRLMATTSTDCLTAAIFAPAEKVAAALAPYAQTVSLAGINSPKETLIAGVAGDVQAVLSQLRETKIGNRLVRVSHASHSPLMEPVLDEFERIANTLTYHTPHSKFISNVTGDLVERVDAAYWRRHMREPVQFATGIKRMAELGCNIFIEMGPQPALLWLGRQNWTGSSEVAWLPSLWSIHADWEQLLQSVGELYVRGVNLDWHGFHRAERRRKVVLPTYPFQRQSYWVNEAAMTPTVQQTATQQTTHNHLNGQTEEPMTNHTTGQALYVPVLPKPQQNGVTVKSVQPAQWQRLRDGVAALFEVTPTNFEADVSFVELGADSLLLGRVAQLVEQNYGVEIGIHQLFDEVSSLDALIAYLAEQRPTQEAWSGVNGTVNHSVTPAPEPAIFSQAPVSQPTFTQLAPAPAPPAVALAPAADAGALERIMTQQMQLVSQMITQQLALLGGQGLSPQPLPSQPPPIQSPALPTLPPATQPTPLLPPTPSTAPTAHHTAPTARPPSAVSYGPSPHAKKLTPQQQQYLDDLTARYTGRTATSKQFAAQGRTHMADSRFTWGFRFEVKELCYPIVGERAAGARFWDIDDNEYIDISMGFGALLCGHNPPFVESALEAQLKKAIKVGPASGLAGEVAKLIRELTGHERVLFSTSGTEAVLMALRLVRAATGRAKIVMFSGAYHGQSDGVLALPNPNGGEPQTIPMTIGVSANAVGDVLVLPYDDPKSLAVIKAQAHELAAVLVEPVPGRRPDVQPKAFLQALRQLTAETGVALIFDEMITGFRIHPGGSQAWFGVQADLATYGKIVGGGLPVGIVAGKACYLDHADGGAWHYGDSSYPLVEKSFVAGTFIKHPLAMAASHAMLHHLKTEGAALQEQLNERTQHFADTVNAFFAAEQVPMRVANFGSLFRFIWKGNASYVYQPLEIDLFYYELLEKGVYTWEGRTCYLSTAHSDADVAQIIHVIKESVAAMQRGGFLPKTSPAPISSHAQQTTNGHQAHPGALLSKEKPSSEVEIIQYPLTEEQKALWAINPTEEEAVPEWRNTVNLLLNGPLRPDLLRQALQKLVDRHEALRTTVARTGDFQTVQPPYKIAVAEVDLTHLQGEAQQAAIQAWLAADPATPFSLSTGPLYRFALLKLADESHQLVITLHHIMSDGWSIGILFEELGTLYAALYQGMPVELAIPGLAPQYREFVQWQAQQADTARMAAQEAYWLAQWDAGFPVANLPTAPSGGGGVPSGPGAPRRGVKSYRGRRYSAQLPVDLCNGLKALGRAQGCTFFMTLLTGYALLLHQLTGQQELIVGTPTAGRSFAGSKGLVGYCPHFLPLYSQIEPQRTVTAQMAALKQTVLAAFKHQEVPFAHLFNKVKATHALGVFPGMTTLFNLDQSLTPPQLPGVEVQLLRTPTNFALVDFRLDALEVAGELWLDYDYCLDRFEEATIAQWHESFQRLLTGMVANPTQSITDLFHYGYLLGQSAIGRSAIHAQAVA